MTPREVYDTVDLDSIRDFLRSPDLQGQYFERKEHRKPEALAQTISAFANSNPEGGLLIIGVKDDGKIVGVNHPAGTAVTPVNTMLRYPEYLVENPAEYRLAPITDDNSQPNHLLLIYANFSPRRVVELTDRTAYERRGDQTVRHAMKKKTRCGTPRDKSHLKMSRRRFMIWWR
jgi:predicted HTH transcriptional regulator